MTSKPKTTPNWIRVLRGMVYVAFCLLAVGVGVFMFLMRGNDVSNSIVSQTVFRTPPQDIFQKNQVTMLVLGCDEDRYYGGKQILNTSARSDMMLLAKLDFDKKRITAVSIPRDLLVEMPGFRSMKINGFHAEGGKDPKKGRELAKQAVEFVLGVNIDRVVELNYNAFKTMIDMVGGVDVFVDKPLHYDDNRGGLHIHLDPGRQVLDGDKAMGYVRYRHSDSDFKRQERQKSLMYSFKDRLLHQPGKMMSVVEQVRELFNRELEPAEIAAVALFTKNIGNDNIKMGQIPVVELPRKYFLGIDHEKLPGVLEQYNFSEATPRSELYGMDR